MNEKVFTIKTISDELYSRMIGKSIPSEYKNSVDINTLKFLNVSHWGFDNKSHIGEIIVNKNIAKVVIEIFKKLYEVKYKIEKIELIDKYDGNDELSMENNNTSSFNYRKIANSDFISKHSFGMAIDINPLYNPYVKGDNFYPTNAKPYINRDIDDYRYIKHGDYIYNLFISKSFIWGGDWNNFKDYQHFEINVI